MRLICAPGFMEYRISFICKKLRFLTLYCSVLIIFYDLVISFLQIIIPLVRGEAFIILVARWKEHLVTWDVDPLNQFFWVLLEVN